MLHTISVSAHALLGIFVFGALMMPGVFFARIAHSGDVGAIRTAFSIANARGKVFGPLSLLVAILGFWTAYQMGVPLTSGWLIASYIVFVLLFGIGIGIHSRWEAKVFALAQASPLDAPSPALKAAVAAPFENAMHWVSIALWVALFYLMIAKPF